jgi:hypothetical protein
MPKLLLVMVLTMLVAAPAAMAGTRADIIQDCYDDGDLDGNYTPSEIRDARNNIPADIDQYSDCRDVLGRALGGTGDKQVGGGGGSDALGGGPGSGLGAGQPAEPLTPGSPDEQAALDQAALSGGDQPVQVGNGTIVPGAAGLASSSARNPLPASLLAVLILLGLAALAAAAPPVRRRVHARRLA